MTKQELIISGAMLYACEGTKARRDTRGENRFNYSIELTNSTPQIISLFMKFLREIIKPNFARVKGQLFVYKDHNEQKLKEYWANISGIPIGQFTKVIMLKQKGSKYKPNPLGTFKIRYCCKSDFFKLQDMIHNVWEDAKIS